MKKNEIMKLLKDGYHIEEISYMKFKRNKLVKGSKIEYSIKDVIIKSNQFESLREQITIDKDKSSLSHKYYKIR